MKSTLIRSAAVLMGATMLAGAANAETLRWARVGDSLTLDPHAQNEGPTHTLAHQMYEGLLQRDMSGAIIPALATDWAPLDSDPTIWEFNLREGVTFHDGAEFNADDVVFSLNRAMSETSAMKELLASVAEVIKVDDYTVHIRTEGPNPLFPNNLTNLFMMDQGWAEANNVVAVQDIANGEDSFAARNANGTGAFSLTSREPEVRTVLTANPDYWGIGEFPLEVSEIIYTPIQNQATRVAALLSGEVDLIQDIPVQDLDRVGSTDGLKVVTAAQNRVIFLGMQQGEDDLETDNVEGANPFADVRVRQAVNTAVNRDAIRQVVMRGQSDPTGVIMPPFVNGWTEELNTVPETDVDAARALMAEAGYEDGFEIIFNCPNDRYINDEAICQAVVGMLAQIGITANLEAQTRANHFPLIQNQETEFYLLGWGVPTFDSEYVFNFLVHSTTDEYGSWNNTGYSNPEVDEMIVSLASETNLEARNATIGEIWAQVQEDVLYIPIHNQVLNWGMRENIDFPVQPEDQPHFKFLTFN
ncbi:MAG: ABC transporter substrate-binding protein [Rhizobiales bacterium]|nr:ABC transporter substrate-binding protein [Hyphomicrobiales bacterium]MBO6700124.1 ABC transporter substrate-binding protein [Hyphomicrobiales bacterium]MBO6737711.1 ABC transporter substrate-binding protein [Hyphomicrobiales bacterium]MBO6913232.1 ABC transporter substrate-binding protein [Hyphomicrobiales bacterium]MBO6954276.1 ABC transporter substrate-binding protein [Hyphomicrobiales bacterium]